MTTPNNTSEKPEQQTAEQKFPDPYFDALRERYGLTRKQVHVVSSYQMADGRLLIRLGPECHVVLKAESRGADRQRWFGRIRSWKWAQRLYENQEGGPWKGPGEDTEA